MTRNDRRRGGRMRGGQQRKGKKKERKGSGWGRGIKEGERGDRGR